MSGSEFIPFNSPSLPESAFDLMRDAYTRKQLSGDGHYTRQCESWIEQRLGVHRALLTTSCSTALEMAMLLLDVGPGDEVILPSFTFVSCANAVVLRGATPVFADIDETTLSLSPATVEARWSPRTKAVMIVHYAGVSRDALALRRLCDARGVPLVEDAAHGFLSAEEGCPLGTIGTVAALSFHETKNFSMGEGGALLVSNQSLADQAEIMREKGTNRKQFFQGLVDKYTWVGVGSSFLPSEILAAVLWAQLLEADRIQREREQAWNTYRTGLADWAEANDIRLPSIPSRCTSSHHMFQLVASTAGQRQALLEHFRSNGVGAVFHYLPLEQSPFGSTFAQQPCVVSSSISSRILRLPLFPGISEWQLDRVLDVARSFRYKAE